MKKLFTLLTILFITSTFAQQRLIAIKGAVTDTIANDEFNNLMQQMINFIFVELWKNYVDD